jgi:alanine dehydrogenase
MASAVVVTDVTAQCAKIGDLHHAIEAGAIKEADVYAELPALLVGGVRRPEAAERITIFDSTGIGLQDVAAAALVYNAARLVGGS